MREGPGRRAVALGLGLALSGAGAQAAAPPAVAAELAGRTVRVAMPGGRRNAPRLILLPGLGPPQTPQALAAVLPPLPGALSIYAPLPFAPGSPGGGIDGLVRRQQEDYAGSLLVPLLSAAAPSLEALSDAAVETYALAADRPVHLFGFSMGGAAALAALSRSRLRLGTVVALNAPLSVRAAVAAYERKLKTTYVPRGAGIFGAYDLAAEADEIRRRQPGVKIRLLHNTDDDQFTTEDARRACAALRAAGVDAALTLAPQGGHNALATHADTQRRVRAILAQHLHA